MQTTQKTLPQAENIGEFIYIDFHSESAVIVQIGDHLQYPLTSDQRSEIYVQLGLIHEKDELRTVSGLSVEADESGMAVAYTMPKGLQIKNFKLLDAPQEVIKEKINLLPVVIKYKKKLVLLDRQRLARLQQFHQRLKNLADKLNVSK